MSKVTTTEIPSTIAEPLSAPNNENQVLKFTEPNICTTSEIKPTTQIETMDKITDVRNNLIDERKLFYINFYFVYQMLII